MFDILRKIERGDFDIPQKRGHLIIPYIDKAVESGHGEAVLSYIPKIPDSKRAGAWRYMYFAAKYHDEALAHKVLDAIEHEKDAKTRRGFLLLDQPHDHGLAHQITDTAYRNSASVLKHLVSLYRSEDAARLRSWLQSGEDSVAEFYLLAAIAGSQEQSRKESAAWIRDLLYEEAGAVALQKIFDHESYSPLSVAHGTGRTDVFLDMLEWPEKYGFETSRDKSAIKDQYSDFILTKFDQKDYEDSERLLEKFRETYKPRDYFAVLTCLLEIATRRNRPGQTERIALRLANDIGAETCASFLEELVDSDLTSDRHDSEASAGRQEGRQEECDSPSGDLTSEEIDKARRAAHEFRTIGVSGYIEKAIARRREAGEITGEDADDDSDEKPVTDRAIEPVDENDYNPAQRAALYKRWRTVARQDPPHIALLDVNPHGFKRALYEEILPDIQYACRMEKAAVSPEARAGALATIFSNRREVERYLEKAVSQWYAQYGGPLSNAAFFSLPPEGAWDIPRWKDKIAKYGPAFARALPRAVDIENYLQHNNLPFPESPKKLQQILQDMPYARQDESPDLARIAKDFDVDEARFNLCLDFHLAAKNKTDCLPDMTIDGEFIGAPGYYMRRLPKDDPRAPLLGHYTDCCQYIGRPNLGGPCTEHGMTSNYGGFYVWQQKTDGKVTDDDQIVAQSWAWVGQDHRLVFDSFEKDDDEASKLAAPFLQALAANLESLPGPESGTGFAGIRLGTKGQTPILPFDKAANPSVPIDFYLRRDSEDQYEIPAQPRTANP